MYTTKKWVVEIAIAEHEGCTRAQARLHEHDHSGLVGVGYARRNPADTDVPHIGDALAASRALAKLAHELLFAAMAELERSTATRVFVKA
ncbi:MAG: DUF1876 domain-containing protein [Nocardiaceae bacterium]|nr:DUF1876 domain-containing protein [Nocardiaceae bacterium]